MTAGNRLQPRLVLLCGLPASGKTTLARELADAYGAVRLNPDEWKRALDADPFDEHFRVGLEGQLLEPSPDLGSQNQQQGRDEAHAKPLAQTQADGV